MCGIPTMPKFTITVYIRITVTIMFLILLYASKLLIDKNNALTETNTRITLSYEDKVKALTTCSDGVLLLKKKELELTQNAAGKVKEAKKESSVEFRNANEYLFKKAKAPVITNDNVLDYGGEDLEAQLSDYLASQKLMNDFIDERVSK